MAAVFESGLKVYKIEKVFTYDPSYGVFKEQFVVREVLGEVTRPRAVKNTYEQAVEYIKAEVKE